MGKRGRPSAHLTHTESHPNDTLASSAIPKELFNYEIR